MQARTPMYTAPSEPLAAAGKGKQLPDQRRQRLATMRGNGNLSVSSTLTDLQPSQEQSTQYLDTSNNSNSANSNKPSNTTDQRLVAATADPSSHPVNILTNPPITRPYSGVLGGDSVNNTASTTYTSGSSPEHSILPRSSLPDATSLGFNPIDKRGKGTDGSEKVPNNNYNRASVNPFGAAGPLEYEDDDGIPIAKPPMQSRTPPKNDPPRDWRGEIVSDYSPNKDRSGERPSFEDDEHGHSYEESDLYSRQPSNSNQNQNNNNKTPPRETKGSRSNSLPVVPTLSFNPILMRSSSLNNSATSTPRSILKRTGETPRQSSGRRISFVDENGKDIEEDNHSVSDCSSQSNEPALHFGNRAVNIGRAKDDGDSGKAPRDEMQKKMDRNVDDRREGSYSSYSSSLSHSQSRSPDRSTNNNYTTNYGGARPVAGNPKYSAGQLPTSQVSAPVEDDLTLAASDLRRRRTHQLPDEHHHHQDSDPSENSTSTTESDDDTREEDYTQREDHKHPSSENSEENENGSETGNDVVTQPHHYSGGLCRECGKIGHVEEDCPELYYRAPNRAGRNADHNNGSINSGGSASRQRNPIEIEADSTSSEDYRSPEKPVRTNDKRENSNEVSREGSNRGSKVKTKSTTSTNNSSAQHPRDLSHTLSNSGSKDRSPHRRSPSTSSRHSSTERNSPSKKKKHNYSGKARRERSVSHSSSRSREDDASDVTPVFIPPRNASAHQRVLPVAKPYTSPTKQRQANEYAVINSNTSSPKKSTQDIARYEPVIERPRSLPSEKNSLIRDEPSVSGTNINEDPVKKVHTLYPNFNTMEGGVNASDLDLDSPAENESRRHHSGRRHSRRRSSSRAAADPSAAVMDGTPKPHRHRHRSHSRRTSESPAARGKSLDQSVNSNLTNPVMRKKLVVVTKRKSTSGTPSEEDPVVRMTLYPIEEKKRIVKSPIKLEKLIDHVAGSHTERGRRSISEDDREKFREALSSKVSSRRTSVAPSSRQHSRHRRRSSSTRLEEPSTSEGKHRARSASGRHSSVSTGGRHHHHHKHRSRSRADSKEKKEDGNPLTLQQLLDNIARQSYDPTQNAQYYEDLGKNNLANDNSPLFKQAKEGIVPIPIRYFDPIQPRPVRAHSEDAGPIFIHNAQNNTNSSRRFTDVTVSDITDWTRGNSRVYSPTQIGLNYNKRSNSLEVQRNPPQDATAPRRKSGGVVPLSAQDIEEYGDHDVSATKPPPTAFLRPWDPTGNMGGEPDDLDLFEEGKQGSSSRSPNKGDVQSFVSRSNKKRNKSHTPVATQVNLRRRNDSLSVDLDASDSEDENNAYISRASQTPDRPLAISNTSRGPSSRGSSSARRGKPQAEGDQPPPYAPPVADINVDRLSKEWQDTLRSEQQKKKKKSYLIESVKNGASDDVYFGGDQKKDLRGEDPQENYYRMAPDGSDLPRSLLPYRMVTEKDEEEEPGFRVPDRFERHNRTPSNRRSTSNYPSISPLDGSLLREEEEYLTAGSNLLHNNLDTSIASSPGKEKKKEQKRRNSSGESHRRHSRSPKSSRHHQSPSKNGKRRHSSSRRKHSAKPTPRDENDNRLMIGAPNADLDSPSVSFRARNRDGSDLHPRLVSPPRFSIYEPDTEVAPAPDEKRKKKHRSHSRSNGHRKDSREKKKNSDRNRKGSKSPDGRRRKSSSHRSPSRSSRHNSRSSRRREKSPIKDALLDNITESLIMADERSTSLEHQLMKIQLKRLEKEQRKREKREKKKEEERKKKRSGSKRKSPSHRRHSSRSSSRHKRGSEDKKKDKKERKHSKSPRESSEERRRRKEKKKARKASSAASTKIPQSFTFPNMFAPEENPYSNSDDNRRSSLFSGVDPSGRRRSSPPPPPPPPAGPESYFEGSVRSEQSAATASRYVALDEYRERVRADARGRVERLREKMEKEAAEPLPWAQGEDVDRRSSGSISSSRRPLYQSHTNGNSVPLDIHSLQPSTRWEDYVKLAARENRMGQSRTNSATSTPRNSGNLGSHSRRNNNFNDANQYAPRESFENVPVPLTASKINRNFERFNTDNDNSNYNHNHTKEGSSPSPKPYADSNYVNNKNIVPIPQFSYSEDDSEHVVKRNYFEKSKTVDHQNRRNPNQDTSRDTDKVTNKYANSTIGNKSVNEPNSNSNKNKNSGYVYDEGKNEYTVTEPKAVQRFIGDVNSIANSLEAYNGNFY